MDELSPRDRAIESLLAEIRKQAPETHARAHLDVILTSMLQGAIVDLSNVMFNVKVATCEVRDELKKCQATVGENTKLLSRTIETASAASEGFAAQLAKSTRELARWTKWLVIATILVAAGTIALFWQESRHQVEASQETRRAAAPPTQSGVPSGSPSGAPSGVPPGIPR